MHSDDPQQLELLRVCRIGRARGSRARSPCRSLRTNRNTGSLPVLCCIRRTARKSTWWKAPVPSKNRWIIKFEGIHDRDASKPQWAWCCMAKRTIRSEMLEADEWYPKDLIGLEARLADGNTAGSQARHGGRQGGGRDRGGPVAAQDPSGQSVKDADGVVVENSALVPFVDEARAGHRPRGRISDPRPAGRTHSGALIRCFFNKALAIMPAPFSYAPRLAGVPVLWNIMKIDIVSVFPEYFEVLNLSLPRQGAGEGPGRSHRAQPARLDARRAPFRG